MAQTNLSVNNTPEHLRWGHNFEEDKSQNKLQTVKQKLQNHTISQRLFISFSV